MAILPISGSLVEDKCSSYVLFMELDDIRFTRLFHLADHERVVVRCPCGANIEFHPGAFPKRYRTPSDTLIYDLQFRLRCQHCKRRRGFEIAIGSIRRMGTSSAPIPARIVVPMEPGFEVKPTQPKLMIVRPEPDAAS